MNSTPLSKKALLIINPVSGKKQIRRYIPDVIRSLMDEGYLVTTAVSSRRNEATELVQEHGHDYDLICCTGGDGTLNEVLTGMAREGLDRPLGYIPCGSTNDFATSHALATDILTAAKNMASGPQKRYDIGRFEDKFFSYVAAFGAFSWLSYTTDQNLKNLLGHTAYILDGIKDVYKLKPYRISLTADGVRYEGNYFFGAVCNSLSIAGTINLPPSQVNTNDGLFEVLLIKMPETIAELEGIIHGLVNQDYSRPGIDFFHASEINIENAPGLEWALDGECSGFYETIHIEPMRGFLNLQG